MTDWLQSSTSHLPASPDLDREYRQVTFDALPPVSAGMAVLFILFIVFNLLDLPASARGYVVAHDVVVLWASVILFWLSRRERFGSRWAPVVASGFGWLVASNVLLAQTLLGRPFYTVYIGIIVIGVGAFVLTTPHMAVALAGIVGAWAASAAVIATPTELAHYAFTLAAAGMVGITIHVARRRSHYRIAQLRFRDAVRKEALERALRAEEQARRGLDRKVEERTKELREMHAALVRELEERKQLERRRQELESHLQHAQKVESLGRLAGGVAHDFNNLLTVLGGSIQLALAHPETPEVLRPSLRDGEAAARTAGQVTRQLLAFSRRQHLAQRALRLEEVVQGLDGMLRNITGEGVALEVVLGKDAGCVYADPGLLEQAIMNLAINARDAMPEGGTLTVRMERAVLDDAFVADHPGAQIGDFVRLDVVDTGVGMDEVTRRAIFEPFFTTKPAEKGTGLGLAMVHGIVTQHGGFVLVETAPGQGSTFSVYLPRLESESLREPVVRGAPRADLTDLRGTETVLVVEDVEPVRQLLVNLLRSLGYRVLVAAGGKEALDLSRAETAEIHLLVTDLVMPGLSGGDLGSLLAAERPTLTVVYVSGCSDEDLPGGVHLVEGLNFVPKPFTVERLAQTIRTALEAQYRRRTTPRGSWFGQLQLGAQGTTGRGGPSRPPG